MKKFVVDASTTLKWIFIEEDSKKARDLLSEYLGGKIILVAPKLWCIEVANAIRSAVLAKHISFKKGEKLLMTIYKVKPKLVDTDNIMNEVFKNACKYQISVYDSVYLSLASENKICLITADEKFYRKVRDFRGVTLLNQFAP